MGENGGRWQMAFWVVSVFTVIVGGSVVFNDRVRATEDQRVECKIEEVCKEQTMVNQQILVSLGKIETDVNYIKQEMKK